MTQIIAVANPKGGVAKTITAVSLAGALANLGQEVLLIDLDPQAHMSMAMGVNLSKVRRSILDVLYGPNSLYNVIRESRIPGIDIIPSRPELAEKLLEVPYDPALLLQAFKKSDPADNTDLIPQDLAGYDFVIMDCPPAWSAILFGALRIASLMLIPSQPEYFSAYNLRVITGIINDVRQFINPNLAYRILITMLDSNNPLHQELDGQIRGTFAGAVFNTAIDYNPALSRSAISGMPITHSEPDNPAAQQYLALAQELIQYAQGT